MRIFLTLATLAVLYLKSSGQVRLDFSENGMPVGETIKYRSAALLPEKTMLQLGSVVYGKSFVGVSQHYIAGNYAFGEQNQRSIGILIHVKNRGSLINESAAKLAYKQSISINEHYDLALAGTGGFYNISLDGTNTTPGASDIAFDSDWSFAIKRNALKASFYYGNINQAEILLIEEGIRYNHYLGTYLENRFTYTNRLTGTIQINWFRQLNRNFWRASYIHELISDIFISLNGNKETLGASFAIDELELAGGVFKVFLGYSFPFFSGNEVVTSPFQVQLVFNPSKK